MTTHQDYKPTAFEQAMADYYQSQADMLRKGGSEAADLASVLVTEKLNAVYAAPASSAREARAKIDLYLTEEREFDIEHYTVALLESLKADFSRAIKFDREAWTATPAETAQGVTPLHARA